jgi:hypothetical protein
MAVFARTGSRFWLVTGGLVVAAMLASGVVGAQARVGSVVRVAARSSVAPSNGSSWGPAISANGRFVAFGSNATNLVAHSRKRCGRYICDDVYVRDRQAGTTEKVNL